ncbi:MAG: cell division ATP-binding protein FtsE [Bacteroidaceae bacterium]
MEVTEHIVKYENVNIKRGNYTILSGVNMTVSKGEMVYLTGPVGSGKSSLLKTMYGELKCTGSEALVLGQDMLHLHTRYLPALRRQMGIVFQDFQLLHDRNVRANLEFVLCATGWGKKSERTERIDEVLELVGLQKQATKRTYELSGGEQQRVCIARALLNKPSIILADEPTGNLDSENGELTMALLDEVRRQYKASVIVSTHNMLWPDYFPGTVYCCKEGRLYAQPVSENQ